MKQCEFNIKYTQVAMSESIQLKISCTAVSVSYYSTIFKLILVSLMYCSSVYSLSYWIALFIGSGKRTDTRWRTSVLVEVT